MDVSTGNVADITNIIIALYFFKVYTIIVTITIIDTISNTIIAFLSVVIYHAINHIQSLIFFF